MRPASDPRLATEVKRRPARLSRCRPRCIGQLRLPRLDWLRVSAAEGFPCASSERSSTTIGGIEPERIAASARAEAAAFSAARPKSQAKVGNGLPGFFGGVPMHWMNDWPTPFPILVDSARGATITDIDGNRLDDFCLGDTGSMFGHSPPPVARAIRRQAGRGLTYMLPSRRRAGHRAAAASSASACRSGRSRRRRPTPTALRCASPAPSPAGEKILVFNGCYHGAVDETFVRLDDGKPANQPGLAGEFRDLTRATKVVEFNDVAALEAALADSDVACVITEPVLTNCCMVLPEPGFHDALRRLTREAGTLLLIDETHTISTGPGGYTRKLRARAGPVRARQAGRRRRAGQRLGHERRGRRRATPPTTGPRSRAIPAWARRCRPIRCSSRPCAPRWKR